MASLPVEVVGEAPAEPMADQVAAPASSELGVPEPDRPELAAPEPAAPEPAAPEPPAPEPAAPKKRGRPAGVKDSAPRVRRKAQVVEEPVRAAAPPAQGPTAAEPRPRPKVAPAVREPTVDEAWSVLERHFRGSHAQEAREQMYADMLRGMFVR